MEEEKKEYVSRGTIPVYITGKCKYARTKKPDEKYEKWTITVYPDETSMKEVYKLIDEGIKNKLRKDEDGYNISFGRPTFIRSKKGPDIPLAAPIVMNKDGVVIEDLIGDGSDVTVKLETYGGPGPRGVGRYKAARLAAIRINNLVPYTRDSMTDEQKHSTKGIMEQPIQLF